MADAPQVVYGDSRPEVYRPEIAHCQQAPPRKQEFGAYYDDSHAERDVPRRDPATILGVRLRNFWILVVVAIVIVAATIGGSVGGAMAVRDSGYAFALQTICCRLDDNRNSSKSESAEAAKGTPTSKPTSVSTSKALRVTLVSIPTGTLTAPSPSPTASRSIYTPPPAASVALIDISCPPATAPSLKSYNDERYACTQGKGINGNDITGISAYSLQQCIDACSTFNTRGGSTKCAAVVLNADLAKSYDINNGANCWLKDTANLTFDYGPGDPGGTIAVFDG